MSDCDQSVDGVGADRRHVAEGDHHVLYGGGGDGRRVGCLDCIERRRDRCHLSLLVVRIVGDVDVEADECVTETVRLVANDEDWVGASSAKRLYCAPGDEGLTQVSEQFVARREPTSQPRRQESTSSVGTSAVSEPVVRRDGVSPAVIDASL